MLILLWLLPAALATAVAILWAARAERDQPATGYRSEKAEAKADRRFADAINRPLVVNARRPDSTRERSSGVAIRRE